jgi:hypothetical protein
MSEDRTIVWETDLPLLSPDVVRQWTMAMLATGTVMLLILGTIFGAQGEWDSLTAVAGLILAVVAGLWLLGFVIMAVLFRGRYRVRYTLSDDGILCESIEPVARNVNRLAVLLGLVSRRPGLLGAGVIAGARESEQVRWAGGFVAVPRPERHLIALRNRWRTLMLVQCTADNYADVGARVEQSIAGHGTASRVAGKSPLPFYLGHTILVVLASASLVMVSEAYDLSLFAPILVLCFALATLWLVNLFGYVVMVGIAYVAVTVVFDLLQLRHSYLFPGQTYRGYEVVGSDDLELLLLGVLGSAYLVWLSLHAVRGRFLALLVRDSGDMAGD